MIAWRLMASEIALRIFGSLSGLSGADLERRISAVLEERTNRQSLAGKSNPSPIHFSTLQLDAPIRKRALGVRRPGRVNRLGHAPDASEVAVGGWGRLGLGDRGPEDKPKTHQQ